MKLRYYIMSFIVGIFMSFSVAGASDWFEADAYFDQMRQTKTYSAVLSMDDGNVGKNDIGVVIISCELPSKSGHVMFGTMNKTTGDLDRVLGVSEVFVNNEDSMSEVIDYNAMDYGINIKGLQYVVTPKGSDVQYLPDGIRIYPIDELLKSLSNLKEFGYSLKTVRDIKDIYFYDFDGIKETQVWKNCVE